jgi:hypothetical protein
VKSTNLRSGSNKFGGQMKSIWRPFKSYAKHIFKSCKRKESYSIIQKLGKKQDWFKTSFNIAVRCICDWIYGRHLNSVNIRYLDAQYQETFKIRTYLCGDIEWYAILSRYRKSNFSDVRLSNGPRLDHFRIKKKFCDPFLKKMVYLRSLEFQWQIN